MDEQGDVPMQVSGTLSSENHGLSNASEPAAGATVGPAAAETVSDRRRTPFAAFISYRHTEPDRRWAKWLHSALERYRVPKQLVRQLGVSGRIGRIFRDEEELAASSDLSAGIREALENSEYLIVVCSPRTPLSEWVNAEIEHFRSLGQSQRILALLIEGEPSEAFPKALREIRRSVVDATGQSREKLETLEPLAAEVREHDTDRRRFRERMAKLRLLATILGCRFDDLRQREQERRRRTITYAVAFLVVLSSPMAGLGFWAERNRRTAVAERDRALRNQSLFLANLSNQQTARGDGTAGMLLALEALPRDLSRPERPYVAEAETSLHQAIYARRELAVFRHADPIKVASVSHRGVRILTVSEDGSARLWNGVDGVEVATLRGHEAPIRQAQFSPDAARILTISEDGAARLWNTADGAALALLGGRETLIRQAAFSPDGVRILTSSEGSAARLWDAASGRPLATLATGIGTPGSFSPDGLRILTASLEGT